MALVQIEMASSGRVIWAKLSRAAKMVARGRACYVAAAVEAEPEATPEVAAPPAAPTPAPKRGRR